MTEPFPPQTIRPSSLTTYSDCPRRFAAHHLVDEVAAAGYRTRNEPTVHIGAAIGSGVHAGAAYTMNEKRTHDTLGNENEALDRAQNEFDTRAAYGVAWDSTTTGLNVARRQLQRMTQTYRRNLAPQLVPVLVEDRLAADLGDGWSLSGQIDAMTGSPDNILEDLKTGVRMRANGVQYAAYGMLVQAHGYTLHGIAEKFIKRVRVDKEQPLPLSVAIDLASATADTWELLRSIKRDATEFNRRVHDTNGPAPLGAFSANPASVLCSPRFCRAWGTEFCTAHRKDIH